MKPRKSLRVKILLLFSIAVLVPAAIISITTITLGYKSLWNSVKREQKEIARRVGDTIRFRIDSIEHLIQSLSKRDYSNVNIPNIKNSFRDIIKLDESILEIILTERRTARDITGVIKNHGKWGDSTLSNRRNRDEFTGAQKDGTYVSKVTFSGTRIPYIIISASGKKHLVVAKVDLRGIWDTISKIQVGENGYAFIVDAGGMLIAHPATERVIAHADFTNLGVVKDFLDGKKDISGIYRDDAGEKVISFCYTIKKLGWGVFTNLPYKEVISPVNKMVFRVISLSGAFSAVFLFVGLKFASSFMNPLMQLKKAAERLSEGKFDVELNVKSDDELEELAGTFSKMIKSLRELEELRDDLISMIVHDMKSPLSGIVGSLDYLIATKKDIEEQKEI
ncbi:MAG: cache domain-containing protein, partial [Elusimicrobiota bacterium]